MNIETLSRPRVRAGFGVPLMALGALLVLSAGLLFLYNLADAGRAAEAASRVAGTLTARIEALPEAAVDGEAEDSSDAIFVGGDAYLGVLRIPALGLALPVMRDWSYEKLKISPCLYSGDTASDTAVIAAHNYKRHFGGIHTLAPGDELIFTDVIGHTIRYEIAKTETLEATDFLDMTASGYDLTLFTCTYGGAARVTVRCNRIPDSV
ncbi:MAG: sortase [Clostridiales Family XIII bacterium]|jgi:sortase A|nr:sortase [Clostridiales Family XIII bacterium]